MEKINYRVEYVGLREGYQIFKTFDSVDFFEVFPSFEAAKKEAIERAKNDIELVKIALKNTKQIKENETQNDW